MDKPKNPGGRPPKTEAERLKQRSIRLADEHWAKYDAGGGIEWLRVVLDRTRVPPVKKKGSPGKLLRGEARLPRSSPGKR